MINSKTQLDLTRKETRATLSKSFNLREGVIKINAHNTMIHEISKAIVCYELAKQGKTFITEGIFENGKRADIVVLEDFEAIEILHTEQEKNLLNKNRDYPIFVRGMKADDVLKQGLKEMLR